MPKGTIVGSFDSNFKLSKFFSSVEVLHFHQQCMSDPLFYLCLLAFSVIIVFRSHFDKCTVIYHCAISLHFPDDHLSMCLFDTFFLFSEMSLFHTFCPFF